MRKGTIKAAFATAAVLLLTVAGGAAADRPEWAGGDRSGARPASASDEAQQSGGGTDRATADGTGGTDETGGGVGRTGAGSADSTGAHGRGRHGDGARGNARPVAVAAAATGPATTAPSPPAVETPSAPAAAAATAVVAAAPRAVTRGAPQRTTAPGPVRRRRTPARRRVTGAPRGHVAATPVAAAGRRVAVGHLPSSDRAPHVRPAPRATRASSPITRIATRVLEVIPAPLLWAFGALAGIGLLLAGAAVWQTRRARRLAHQHRSLAEDVGVLQAAVLPAPPPVIGRTHVSAAYRPAEGLAAGGDFYDAFEMSGARTAVIVGDVAGHGRESVPLTARVRYSLRAYLEAGLEPRTAIAVAGDALDHELAGRLVTVMVAVYDGRTGRLSYACAGHPPPLLAADSARPATVCSSPPLGAGLATGRRQTSVSLPPGAAALFYTDGLADSRAGETRIGDAGVARALASLDRGQGATELLARIARETQSQPDDMAAVLLRPAGSAPFAPSRRVELLEADPAALRDGAGERFLVAVGVPVDALPGVLEEAREIATRCGTVVLTVTDDRRGVRAVASRPPVGSVILPVRVADAPTTGIAA